MGYRLEWPPLPIRPANNASAAPSASPSAPTHPYITEHTNQSNPSTYSNTALTLPDAPPADAHINEEIQHQRRMVKNRRARYLELHPEYLTDPELELADPQLYYWLIKRFQTAAERQASRPNPHNPLQRFADLQRTAAKDDEPGRSVPEARGPAGEVVDENAAMLMSREEGVFWWRYEMTERFLRGDDDQFDYGGVDENAVFGVVDERDREDEYFDSEPPGVDLDSEGRPIPLLCETGILDY